MPSMECAHCDGTGYTQDAASNAIICPWCEGTGVVFVDETARDTIADGAG